MGIHDLRDYYKRQENAATRLMMAQPDGPSKQSTEEAVTYFRARFFHFNALCAEAKP